MVHPFLFFQSLRLHDIEVRELWCHQNPRVGRLKCSASIARFKKESRDSAVRLCGIRLHFKHTLPSRERFGGLSQTFQALRELQAKSRFAWKVGDDSAGQLLSLAVLLRSEIEADKGCTFRNVKATQRQRFLKRMDGKGGISQALSRLRLEKPEILALCIGAEGSLEVRESGSIIIASEEDVREILGRLRRKRS